jgi:hypothetical protein
MRARQMYPSTIAETAAAKRRREAHKDNVADSPDLSPDSSLELRNLEHAGMK